MVLKIIDRNDDTAILIDVSKEGIGRTLTQNGHVIIYASKNFKEHDMNYRKG